jgi:uncharacterized protein DUF1801
MVSSPALSVKEYLASLPAERRSAIVALRKVIRQRLPPGFEEGMEYGMLAYFVPLSRFPDTYNGKPLTVAALASHASYMSLYLMGVYGDPAVERSLVEAFDAARKKLDRGKACVRFKSLDDLPLEAIGDVIASVGVDDFIAQHEAAHGAGAHRRASVARKTASTSRKRAATSRKKAPRAVRQPVRK